MAENHIGPEPSGVVNGDRIAPTAIVGALTRVSFLYADGTAQVFTADGRTTFTEQDGTTAPGEWGVDERGRFWSFWPPSYRAEYDLSWIAKDGQAVGVRFVELRTGRASEGRYAGM